MLNKVILAGNLGADPEVRHAQSGTTITSLRVATNNKRMDANGQWVDDTQWHRVVAFGSVAESCERYLTKGSKILVDGRLQTRQYDDRDGNRRYVTEVIAHTVTFLGGTKPRTEQSQQQSHQQSLGDDDIPF